MLLRGAATPLAVLGFGPCGAVVCGALCCTVVGAVVGDAVVHCGAAFLLPWPSPMPAFGSSWFGGSLTDSVRMGEPGGAREAVGVSTGTGTVTRRRAGWRGGLPLPLPQDIEPFH